MIQEDTLRDRMVRLETDVKHISNDLEGALKKIDEMHNVMMQAKGARWVIIAAASIAGAVAGFAAKFAGLLGGLPR